MKQHQAPIGKNQEWLTPPDLLSSLGVFDLDPCAPVNRPWSTAKNHFTILDDGLNQEWKGRVWCNPPFDKRERPKWMEKVSSHGNGVMLIPAATETKAFFKYVWEKADGVLFLKGRPCFYYKDGTKAKMNCGTAICLVAYGSYNKQCLALLDSGKFLSI